MQLTPTAPIPMQIKIEQLVSDIYTLGNLSTKGYQLNEQIKQRQEKLNKATQKNRAEYERIKRNMEQQKQAKAKLKLQQDRNRQKVKSLRKIKRTSADAAFSLCVRLRANCTCERCGEKFPSNAMAHLHCSHNYSREYQQVRFHPDNAFALCKDCHWWFSRSKVEATAWKNEKLGEQRQQALFQALESDHLKSISKTEEKRIASYYNLLARYLKTERENGNSEYLAFRNYY